MTAVHPKMVALDDHAAKCYNCRRFVNVGNSVETRDGSLLCDSCAVIMNFCEVCGSTAFDPDNQRHYDVMCFS